MDIRLLWFGVAACVACQPPPLRQDGDRLTMAAVSSDAAEAHLSANAFAKEVGDRLKASYPSRLVDPSVQLHVSMRDGKRQFRLTWSCRIVPSSEQDADWVFDRRGTLMPGTTPEEAARRVEDELARSGKVVLLRRSFPNGRMPGSFVSSSSSGSASEGYWHIREFFLTAPK